MRPGLPSTILVAVGGAIGATARWAVVSAAADGSGFPWWTLAVNVAGCLVLGALAGRSDRVVALVGVGVCGGLTTFSTFSVELAGLLDDGRAGVAVAYLVASLVLGVAGVVAGRGVAARRVVAR